MLSRVADCAYWMTRYLEGAEHTPRIGQVSGSVRRERSSDAVRRLMRATSAPPTGYGPPLPDASEISSDERLMLTIAACVAAARENARQGREQISSEMWEQLNRLYLHVRQKEAAEPAAFYIELKEAVHLFQ